ncbi:MAG: nickel-dependent lactate racemase [Ignavibacteriales bacterium]|nr:nickel-dependent lactate racemase [Ignavibacteriales bacterium]
MKIHLAYGKHGLDIEVPDKNLAKVLTLGTTTPLAHPEQSIEKSLLTPIGSPPLSELAGNARSVCIAVCDITRPVPNKQLLPPILRILEEGGVVQEKITILIATGLHRPSTSAEKELMLGREIVSRYRVVDHQASVREEQAYLGVTKKNTPVFIDKWYVEADLKLTVGFIEPHLMAGFSGGRKLIAPGNAGEETIKVLHSPRFLDDPLCREGSIEHNPLHHELLEIARMAGHDFMIDVSLDAGKNITGVFAGDPLQAHAAGVEAVRGFVRATIPAPADIVITTSAGFPLDLTYYQAIKGMTAALPVLRKGGMLILVAECAEGLGGEQFTTMATRFGTAQEFDDWIHNNPVEIDQWQLQECAKAARMADVVVVASGIQDSQKDKLFVQSASTVEKAIKRGLKKFGEDATIAVIPKGPYTLVELEHPSA